MTRGPSVAALCLFAFAVSAGCREERARKPVRPASASASADTGSVAPTIERPMADRREAQQFLDSAAALLARADTDAAVALLHRAAALVQVGATEPRGPASGELLSMADRIDRFSGALARHELVDDRSLSRMSALLNLAEADRHLALASVACSTRSRESIFDELTMAIDHVERAARDGQFPSAGSRRGAIAEARQAAAPLATECAQDLGALEDAIGNLRGEIATMRRSLEGQK